MRQAGLKPKSHSSGTYWIRQNANRAINKGDGIYMQHEIKSFSAHILEWIVVLLIVVFALIGLAQ
tara:strand:+ start:36 stop:230 length:195 start_codon:yes stop_codon:yes gene_type:complete